MTKLNKLVLLLVFSGFLNPVYSQPTVDQILQGLEKREQAIHDLKVMYQSDYYFNIHLDLFAMSSEGYVYETLQSINSTKNNPGLQHLHMIRTVNLIDSTGGFWQPSRNTFEITSPQIPLNFKLNLIITTPYVNNQVFGLLFPLSKLLQKFKDISIEKVEKVDGRECVVILFSNLQDKNIPSGSTFRFRYWIDWKHGYTPVRFQRFYKEDVVIENDYLDLRDFGNDIWLPMKIEFKSNETGSQSGKPRTRTLQVLKISVNENLAFGSLNFIPPRGCLAKEINEWPIKQNEPPSEKEYKEMWKQGEKLTLSEEATYFQRLFGISYPEAVAMFDKIEY